MASEETHKLNSLDDFLTFHSSDLRGSLWIHDEANIEDSMPYHGYNYLFDGMLQQNQNLQQSSHSLFIGEQFANPFLLGLVKEGTSQMDDFLSQFNQTLKNNIEINDNVLVLTKLGKAIPAQVKKKLKDYKLNHITYSL